MITAATRLCLVIGDPIAQSLSPLLHNTAFAAAGIADQFCFCAAHVTTQDLKSAISGCRSLQICGISVTSPHKTAVIPLLDQVDDLARQAGAVNTIVNSKGILHGHNTDINGIIEPIRRHIEIPGKRAVVLGAGGAARAAVFGLKAAGASVVIVNRSPERGLALAREAGVEFFPLSDSDLLQECTIIINTTSVGMHPESQYSPVPESVFRPGQIVLDAVYNPAKTQFLCDAETSGAITISGVEMFLTQGAHQFKLYTGQTPPLEAMQRVIENYFKE